MAPRVEGEVEEALPGGEGGSGPTVSPDSAAKGEPPPPAGLDFAHILRSRTHDTPPAGGSGGETSPAVSIPVGQAILGLARLVLCTARRFAPLLLGACAAGSSGSPARALFLALGCFISGLALWLLDEQFRLALGGRADGGREDWVGLHRQHTDRNTRISALVSFFRAPHYTPPRWPSLLLTGDLLTLMPFLLCRVRRPQGAYLRRWVAVPRSEGPSSSFRNVSLSKDAEKKDEEEKDTEYVAVDVALSPSPRAQGDKGVAAPQPGKPFYLILHGLNGGSAEPYLMDFVGRALDKGASVAVMVSRGLMETPLQTPSMFHGARTSDVEAVVKVLRSALDESCRGGDRRIPLHLVGYSMGGIIAANYAAKLGKDALVDSVISLSGSLDTVANMDFIHSRRTWQPLLAHSLKESFVSTPRYAHLLSARGLSLSKSTLAGVADVTNFDETYVAPYHGYDSVHHYYRDMSAGHDNKLSNLAVPLLVVHALDDPIMLCPDVSCVAMSENLFILCTRAGGHVGWPMGILPSHRNWEWMSTIAYEFSNAVSSVADAS